MALDSVSSAKSVDKQKEKNALKSCDQTKEAMIELLHRKDKQKLKFCELNFGSAFLDKKVRDRAIADRVETIKSSHS